MHFFRLLAPLLLPTLVVASEAARAEWQVGVDDVLEGATLLSGPGTSGSSLHNLALVHVNWERTSPTPQTVQWRAYGSALSLNGKGPTEKFLGDVLAVSNTEGYQSTRLYSWWLEGETESWSLRAGVLLADEEFTGTVVGGHFCNSAFGWPAFISANTVNTGPAFYVAAPGLRLAHTWSDSTTWRLGVYDGDTFDSASGDPRPNRHGLHYQLNDRQGYFAISEISRGNETHVRLGAWFHTASFEDVRDDAAGQPFARSGEAPRSHASNYGVYSSIETTLLGQSEHPGHLAGYLRGGIAPPDRNALHVAVDGGFAWTGLFPRRPADVTALGVAHADFSGRMADNVRLGNSGDPAPDFERAFELSHSFVINPHLSILPDVQFLQHPGGNHTVNHALVGMIRFNASF